MSRASAADLVVEMKHPAVSCTTSLPSPTSGGVGSGGFHIKTDMMYTTGIPVSGVSSGGSTIGGGSLSLNSRIHQRDSTLLICTRNSTDEPLGSLISIKEEDDKNDEHYVLSPIECNNVLLPLESEGPIPQMDHMSGLEMLGSPHSTGGGSTGSAGGPAIDPVSIAMSATPTPLPPSSMSSSGVDHHSQLAAMGMYSHPSSMMSPHPPIGHHHSHHHTTSVPMQDVDADPRELEAFAERFKQRRIKLGVTQCDVGKALANLKLPGVGALSQSTICRFESLTLSHNNMIALKPVLSAWLDEAEAAKRDPDGCHGVLPPGEKKRKRTSIAAPEKRSLEAYFAVQPRPSGEKIAAIAEKLDLKKNVVRVWFCNQRQKQKRMKFAAQGGL
eukprot:TCALIF_06974-PA protein Name:"Similar to pou4f3 POU domain, class 4, transcription factor 3 (Danio rerio)" AED:0.14 eAED:0.14 QI:0/0.2/0.33/0.66/1/1/6/635/385